ncbi:hypothetical protein [Pyrobaculum neutrophilum]|uniref:Uncharacterized protein n=1 Tax=Pyrobaculum neutrophilum (strain DSM 2338 / JCM 9278 / NBRC 100436 / V24Sta) TaxID=444157 RepID=B1YC06_PYRNV|nr:hypothetical protein [Pyrobaculum neutrophilum]ACB40860.1 hypothetical protein Tneu_1945 [Pyrobaculum neutrophilum V24Sta]
MTRWILKCTVCGEERELEAGFNLTLLGGKVYLYCRRCRANREHLVLGCAEPDDLCPTVGADVID